MQKELLFGLTIVVFGLLVFFVVRRASFARNRGERKVVYFGGSITAGAGASSSQTSWAAIIASWLERKHRRTKWTHINAGLGGKSSWYGLIRMQKELIDKKPDLVFVDFAVNDVGTSRGDLQGGFTPAAEAVIRRIKRQAPGAKLVILVLSRPEPVGKEAIDMWVGLGKHYDIQVERLDLELIKSIGSSQPSGEQLARYFLSAVDVHPNDQGHQLIAAMIQRDLKDVESGPQKPIDEYGYFMPHSAIYEASPVILPGEGYEEISGDWVKKEGSIESSQPGASVTWVQNLCSFGVETNVGTGAGKFEWFLDGKQFPVVDLSANTDFLKVIWNFPRAQHTITIKVIEGKVCLHRFYGI